MAARGYDRRSLENGLSVIDRGPNGRYATHRDDGFAVAGARAGRRERGDETENENEDNENNENDEEDGDEGEEGPLVPFHIPGEKTGAAVCVGVSLVMDAFAAAVE